MTESRVNQEFRGTWLPKHIHELFDEGKISALETMLLSTIDSFSGDDGCFASNQFLADRMSTTDRHIRRMVSKMKGMGLVVQTAFDGRKRYLKTKWMGVGTGPSCPLREDEIVRAERTNSSGLPTYKENKVESKPPLTPPGGNENAGEFDFFNGGNGKGRKRRSSESPPASPIDIERAVKLSNALLEKKQMNRTFSKRDKLRWADYFRHLRYSAKGGPDRIGKVLDWYTENLGLQWVPEAWTAKQFRDKFISIEAAMTRPVQKDSAGLPPEAAELPPEAVRVVEDLLTYRWPKGSENQVQSVVGQSWIEYEKFSKWIFRIKDELEADRKAKQATYQSDRSEKHKDEFCRIDHLARFARHVDEIRSAPSHFIKQWMLRVLEDVSDWDGWSGNLGSFAIKIDGKQFQAMGRDWAGNWSEEKEWDRLMEVMESQVKGDE